MKWLLMGMAAVGALAAGSASAADMPVKARPIAEVAYNWSGFYVGGTGGYNNGDLNWVYSSGNVPQQNPFELSGWNGGVFGGVQWQINQLVLGIEANGLWGDISGWSLCTNPAFRCNASVDDVWTVGGRLGWVWGGSGRIMTFASGGFASAKVDTLTYLISTGAVELATNRRHDGSYVGAGLDFVLVGNWIFGMEYRHYWLERNFHGGVVASSIDRTVKPDWDSVQFRLSYKFGWGPFAR
jgi:outer membrane immunogenic protein